MPSLPRVTIVTPSFNQAEFLEETIRSVLSQAYPDLEYFIMDGGSTDGSREIIERYADRLAGWVSEKDKGQADAITKGFARATGEIVAWINSDDYYLPGALHSAVAALEAHPECGMVYGDVISINGAGEPFNVMTYGDWSLEDLMQFKIIGQPAVFLRRKVVEQAGPIDVSYHYLLDHEWWLRIAQVAPIHYVPERWAAARYHAGAKNVSQTSHYGPDALRIVDWMSGQPGLAEPYHRLRRRILAGAYRLGAHYLLDGNQYGPALRDYLRCMWYSPSIALPEMRRILYAFASLFVSVSWMKERYLRKRKEKLSLDKTKFAGGAGSR